MCYCIEPGTPLNIGDVMTKRDESYWDNYPSTYNKTISADEIKLFIGRIFQYGYTGSVSSEWRTQNASDADKLAHIMATQTLIWETVVGERDGNFNHVDTGSYDAVNDRVSKNHPLYSQYISYYNSMVSHMQKHSKVPSFFAKSTSKAQDIELEWNGINYSTTLTDTNNVLGNYSFSASESGVDFSVSGNKLTITATKAPTSKVSIIEEKIISMYAKGMTTNDISAHIEDIYGLEVSDSLVSRITDKILPVVKEWQQRPLESVYAVVFMDAIHYNVRCEGRIVKKAVYIAIGINMDGIKEVLGMYVGENESAKYWLSILNGLKNRGVEDILITCIDGLTGFPEAISAVYPKTEVKQCIIHQIRNSTKYVSYKDIKALMADLKKAYGAVDEETALYELESFAAKWDAKYPKMDRQTP